MDLPVSVLTVSITVPATSVVNRAASRPFSGNSAIRARSTTSLSVEVLVSTLNGRPLNLHRLGHHSDFQRDVDREALIGQQFDARAAEGAKPPASTMISYCVGRRAGNT